MNNINDLHKQLAAEAEPCFGSKLTSDVTELNARWNKVVMLAQEQNTRLKVALKRSEEVHSRIKILTEWLDPIKDDLAHKDYAVTNPNDLLVKTKKFKVNFY